MSDSRATSTHAQVYKVHALSRAFRERVDDSLRILAELPKLGACIVSTSWGKDSCVLEHLARRAWGSVELLHLASSYGLPGDEDLRRVSHHELPARPLREVLSWLEDVELPHERSRSGQAAAVAAIKKDPGRDWALGRGYAVMVLGLRAEENQKTRGLSLRMRGHTYRLRCGLWAANPLAWWTARDLWAYILTMEVPYNRRVYDAESHGLTRETIRNTGWLSTDGAAERGRIAWLRFHFPDYWLALCREFPEMVSYA